MSDYIKKLMELREIKYLESDYFLDIRLSYQKEVDLLWRVDQYTAENLKSVLSTAGNFRYRISFLVPFDLNERQSVGLLARTFRDTSEEVYFACSREYIENLKLIKDAKNLKALDKKTFILGKIPENDQLQKIQSGKINNGLGQVGPEEKKLKLQYRLVTIPMAFVALLFLTSFSHLDNKQPSKIKVASTEMVQIGFNAPRVNEPALKIVADGDMIKEEKTEQVACIELDKTVNAALPKGTVALTFDDGPSKYSREIADILGDNEVGGTFFYIGLHMEKYPENIAYVHSKGFSIGSHSMNHVNFSKISGEALMNELKASMTLLEEQTGAKHYLLRPPFGAYDESTVDLAEKMDYKILLWNNDPEDWKTRNTEKILNHIKNTSVDGSVILLHEQEATVKALPEIITYLKGLGLEIVNLK